MTVVTTTQETYDLSGMGDGYEDACQRMLWRGVAFLDERRPPVEMWEGAKEYQNVYGVMIVEGDDLKALETYIMRDIETTGAMHQCVMGHLRFIHQNGIDGWRAHMAQHRDDSVTWEGQL